jgi:glycosyltransferase involved in cell wall biosynthesis
VLASSRHVLAATAFMRVPTVATLHLVAPILSELQRRTLGHFYRRLPRVIAVSGETKEQLCRDLGVAESVVRVVPNGVPVREPLTLQDRTPVRVGGVGRLTAQKGFDLLIEAIRRLREHGLAVEAVIVGEGPDRAKLEAVAQGLPVTLEGFTPEVGSVLESLDIFCLPSRWEGLPFALLEAMMAGLPCVAARVGDVPEALGAAGALVPPDDLESLIEAVRDLVRSPARRRELGAAAHARAVERYSVDRMVAETADVYEGVLAG